MDKKSLRSAEAYSYAPLPDGVSTQQVVDIIYGYNGREEAAKSLHDFTADELDDYLQLSTVETTEYALPQIYNGMRTAGFSSQYALGILETNIMVMRVAYMTEAIKRVAGGTEVLSRFNPNPAARMGVDMALKSHDRQGLEKISANILHTELDIHGLNITRLDEDILLAKYDQAVLKTLVFKTPSCE